MSVAIRAITRLQDADDVNVTPAVGVDEYLLTYDHDTSKFVLRAPVAAPDLSGYALLAGRAGGQTLYGGTAANDDITIHGTTSATKTSSSVIIQPDGGDVLIGTSTRSNNLLSVNGGADIGEVSLVSGNVILANNQYVAIKNNVGTNIQVAFLNSSNTFQVGNASAGTFTLKGGTYFGFYPDGSGSQSARIANSGLSVFTQGSTAFSATTLLHAQIESAATSTVSNVLTLGHNTTGTAAAGFGAGQLFTLESSTTAAQSAARIQAITYEATHATRKYDLVGTAFDAGGEREGWRVRGDGSGPALGFYGVAPIARAVLATGAGASVDDVITALQNLGLVKQS